MKIRLDYVSNSSTSSFMIIGKTYTHEDVIKAMKKHKITWYDEEYYDEPVDSVDDDILEDVLNNKFDLSMETSFEGSDYDFCIGLHFEDMKDNETKAQFMKRINDGLTKFFGKTQKAEVIEDCGYC